MANNSVSLPAQYDLTESVRQRQPDAPSLADMVSSSEVPNFIDSLTDAQVKAPRRRRPGREEKVESPAQKMVNALNFPPVRQAAIDGLAEALAKLSPAQRTQAFAQLHSLDLALGARKSLSDMQSRLQPSAAPPQSSAAHALITVGANPHSPLPRRPA